MTLLLGCLVTASFALHANAQQPVRHQRIQGDMPPGMAARFYQMKDPSLIGHTQPVQLVAPGDTMVEIGDAAGFFGQARASQMTVGMAIGFVYRFKLSNFPQPDAGGKALYPSIEVIGKLNPPVRLEKDFPVQVVVTREDIDLALSGRMVTRVIYLEDPRGTLPYLHSEKAQPSVNVRAGQDPLQAAEQLGRPMAILRMGSRVPLENEAAEWFTFGISAPEVLPDPRSANLAGLNARELGIVDSVRQAKAKAELEVAKAIETEALEAQVFEAKALEIETEQQRQTGSIHNISDEVVGDKVASAIGTVAQLSDQSNVDVQPVVAITPIAPTLPTQTSPKWIKVKANAKLAAEPRQSAVSNMVRIRFADQGQAVANVRLPAPSLGELDFEPVNSSTKKPQPLLQPLMIRRPNEL